MGLIEKFKKFFQRTKYRINRKILIDYVNETISFCKQENLIFVDEFDIKPDEDGEGMHLVILNYDAPCDTPYEEEKDMTGIVIFLCENQKHYQPATDEKFYSIEDFVRLKMIDDPEWFILINDLGEPKSLEPYKC